MSTDVKFSGEIFRKDHPMILAANRRLASIKPVRLAYDAGGYKAGTVLGQFSAGPKNGLFGAYGDAGASGTDTAVCILFENVEVEKFASASDTRMARGIFSGEVYEAKLTGLSASAKTDLAGRSFTPSTGDQIFKF